MTIRDSVFEACDEIGDLTSLVHLQDYVESLCGKMPNKAYVSILRQEWREENDQPNDCRTYESQDRRDMLDDEIMPTFREVQKLKDWMDGQEAFLIKWMNRNGTHSVPNFLQILEYCKSKKKAA